MKNVFKNEKIADALDDLSDFFFAVCSIIWVPLRIVLCYALISFVFGGLLSLVSWNPAPLAAMFLIWTAPAEYAHPTATVLCRLFAWIVAFCSIGEDF